MVWICYDLPFSIISISIYYGKQSHIRIKSYCHLNLLRASVFNYERVDILRDIIGLPSKKLLSFEFSQSIYFQFRVSRYITGLNRTSELKVIFVWICYELPFSITSVLTYYGTQSDIRVKIYCPMNLLRSSIFYFEDLNISRRRWGQWKGEKEHEILCLKWGLNFEA